MVCYSLAIGTIAVNITLAKLTRKISIDVHNDHIQFLILCDDRV